MNMIMKTEREAHDQHRRADFDAIEVCYQMARCESGKKTFLRKSGALDLYHGDVDGPG